MSRAAHFRSALPRRCWRATLAAGVLAAAASMGAAPRAADIPLAERRSSYVDMSAATRAMQDDDAANPASLWVLDGETLWRAKPASGPACADCHGEATASMRGVAARYPAWDAKQKTAIDLEARINICRVEKQDATALPPESKDLLALTAYLARQSRGLAIAIADPRLDAVITAGRQLFERRQGQLNLACANCHDDNWGRKLAGNVVPQAHPTGYPIYRLEWQTLGSLQRRLRNCLVGMRAESYAFGAPELIALETYLLWRARGMPIESPAVRP
ncbi:MAG TPA: sulfur oxidation c-type cytochrome SoxA [Hyphomicrobiaceae bacterium]|nr:sulfur oxidation c-type cytochrome SoxA [Hyphomicrobiaceae bacterium]